MTTMTETLRCPYCRGLRVKIDRFNHRFRMCAYCQGKGRITIKVEERMKIVKDENGKEVAVQYTHFEIVMSKMFFDLYGGSNLLQHEELYWKDIQDLKESAQSELLGVNCPKCGTPMPSKAIGDDERGNND